MSRKKSSRKKWKILVTPKEAAESLGKVPAALLANFKVDITGGRIQEADELICRLRDKDAAVLDLEKVTQEVFASCPGLKVISRFGEGYDAIDLDSAKRHHVRVARSRGVSSLAVARHTLSLIMAMMHNLTKHNANLKKGIWARCRNIPEGNMTLGILGLGMIGKAVADLASGIGFKILACDNRKIRSRYDFAKNFKELIRLSDVISLHVPLADDTRGIVSGDIIDSLIGKYLVNTARGGVIDEKGLLRALDKGRIKGYATDVYMKEPISGMSKKLAMHPRTVCTPHIAALDEATAVNTTRRTLENALYCLRGEHGRVKTYVV